MWDTERLYIRPWEETDLGIYWALANDIGYNCFSRPGKFLLKNEAKVRQALSARVEHYRENQIGKFPLFARASGEFVGTCGFGFFILDGQRQLELCARLLLKHWGQGYSKEAKSALLTQAFTNLKRDRVFAFCLPQNQRPIQINLNLGFLPFRKWSYKGLDYEMYQLEETQFKRSR